jgi:3'(2'), 5'-bisphosphate nucleotidase
MQFASKPSGRPRDAVAARLAQAALAAGQTIAAARTCGLEVRAKDDGSPCTSADIAAQETILEALARDFPGTAIVAEENAARSPTDCEALDTFLLVDPLDGTGEFLHGGSEYCVCIALIEHGRPVAGALLAPAMGRLWIAGETALHATPEEWRRGQARQIHAAWRRCQRCLLRSLQSA